MNVSMHETTSRTQPGRSSWWRRVRLGFAGLYAGGAVVHVGFALFRPDIYREFAGESPWSWVRDGWRDVFMAEPRLWAVLLAAGELLIAVLLVLRPRLGYLAVIGFTAALALFGWGFLIWSVPVATVAVLSMLGEERTRR